MKAVLLVAAAIALGGCSSAPTTDQPALYDFGLKAVPSSHVPLSTDLVLAEVSANASLQSPAILYRLAYRNDNRIEAYALSRWAAPPADLFAQRLRLALAQARTGAAGASHAALKTRQDLRIHVEAFEQIVDAPSRCRGVVRLHAMLTAGDARFQRVFQNEQACLSVDAPGAVGALTAAADVSIGEVLRWAAEETKRPPGEKP